MGAIIAAIVPLIIKYGPTVWSIVAPLVEKAVADGTLADDVAKLAASLGQAVPALGSIGSLSDLADAIGSVEGAPVESPAMEHATGSSAR